VGDRLAGFDEDEYMKWVMAARKKASNLSISEWECESWLLSRVKPTHDTTSTKRVWGSRDRIIEGGVVATTTGLMAIDQFWKLPDTEPFYYELRHGELFKVSRPMLKHTWVQVRLHELLRQTVPKSFLIVMAFPFRALPEYEFRIADIVVVSRDRFYGADRGDAFRGAPELVIEVLSPSNTAAEMNDREKLCLENGSFEFWVVDANLRQVKVSTPDGITTTFRSGQEIPRAAFGGGAIKVDDFFV
jgi:Uma2 family endonuclease